jgi:two-component system response regulator MprA
VRILVVDDDRAVREALRRALTLGGYEVQAAEEGEQALELVAQAMPDAVVLDIGLPGIDGLEVCRRIRRLGNRVPILMVTARDAVDDRIAGLDVGADDYMIKPFDVGGPCCDGRRPTATRTRCPLPRSASTPRVTGRRWASSSSS